MSVEGADAEGGGGGDDSNIVWFLYVHMGQLPREITHLREKTHVRIDPSVKRIGPRAFEGCGQLREVELCEGLEEICREAFSGCKSLERISKVPSTVKKIGDYAFNSCEQLVEVELCEGLEGIGERAFSFCKSLKRFKVPSTVKKINKGVFSCCHQLVEVELFDGLEEIAADMFRGCKSLKRFKVPSTVKAIGEQAFWGCERLVEVELCEGLEKIKKFAFSGCKSLNHFKVPSTVNVIGTHAFHDCQQLEDLELGDGLERIEDSAFICCKYLHHIRVPSIKIIGRFAFHGCAKLVGVELCDGVENIGKSTFRFCCSLRNCAIPPEAQASICFGPGCHDLMKLFGSQQLIIGALKSRFDRLPIHKLCYYQSNHPTETTMQQIEDIMSIQNEAPNNMHNNQDCLGMTPLHILACSSKHDLELCQFIVAIYPNSLITEDKWGCPPILYAIWGGAAHEIVQFLIGSQKSTFPNHILDWDGMVETLCRAGASLDIVNGLLDAYQASFADQSINWQKAARELTIRILVDCDYYGDWRREFFEDWGVMMEALSISPAYQELVQTLTEIRHQFFSDESDILRQTTCEELVGQVKGWWQSSVNSSMSSFQFIAKCNIAERLNAIGVIDWRLDIKLMVERISSITAIQNLIAHFDTIHSKLVTYEREYHQLKDAAFLLELTLWKSRIDELLQHDNMEHNDQLDDDNADARGQCRISCGADIIIPNVLPYLIAKEEGCAPLTVVRCNLN